MIAEFSLSDRQIQILKIVPCWPDQPDSCERDVCFLHHLVATKKARGDDHLFDRLHFRLHSRRTDQKGDAPHRASRAEMADRDGRADLQPLQG